MTIEFEIKGEQVIRSKANIIDWITNENAQDVWLRFVLDTLKINTDVKRKIAKRLIDIADKDGLIAISQEELARELQCSRSMVVKVFDALLDAGLMKMKSKAVYNLDVERLKIDVSNEDGYVIGFKVKPKIESASDFKLKQG